MPAYFCILPGIRCSTLPMLFTDLIQPANQ
jgi:hypothetical protein